MLRFKTSLLLFLTPTILAGSAVGMYFLLNTLIPVPQTCRDVNAPYHYLDRGLPTDPSCIGYASMIQPWKIAQFFVTVVLFPLILMVLSIFSAKTMRNRLTSLAPFCSLSLYFVILIIFEIFLYKPWITFPIQPNIVSSEFHLHAIYHRAIIPITIPLSLLAAGVINALNNRRKVQ